MFISVGLALTYNLAPVVIWGTARACPMITTDMNKYALWHLAFDDLLFPQSNRKNLIAFKMGHGNIRHLRQSYVASFAAVKLEWNINILIDATKNNLSHHINKEMRPCLLDDLCFQTLICL